MPNKQNLPCETTSWNDQIQAFMVYRLNECYFVVFRFVYFAPLLVTVIGTQKFIYRHLDDKVLQFVNSYLMTSAGNFNKIYEIYVFYFNGKKIYVLYLPTRLVLCLFKVFHVILFFVQNS